MTPGEEALREAMRLEQARIYGQMLAKTPEIPEVHQFTTDRDKRIVLLRHSGKSLAAIALYVGVSKTTVTDVLRRAS